MIQNFSKRCTRFEIEQRAEIEGEMSTVLAVCLGNVCDAKEKLLRERVARRGKFYRRRGSEFYRCALSPDGI